MKILDGNKFNSVVHKGTTILKSTPFAYVLK
jgi:hypothetical protein